MIYMILAPEVDRVKIGISAKVEQRLNNLQTSHSQDLCLVMMLDKPDKYERVLHKRFAKYRVRGEWFQMCPEIAEFIIFNFGWEYSKTPVTGITSAFNCLAKHCPEKVEKIIKAAKQLNII